MTDENLARYDKARLERVLGQSQGRLRPLRAYAPAAPHQRLRPPLRLHQGRPVRERQSRTDRRLSAHGDPHGRARGPGDRRGRGAGPRRAVEGGLHDDRLPRLAAPLRHHQRTSRTRSTSSPRGNRAPSSARSWRGRCRARSRCPAAASTRRCARASCTRRRSHRAATSCASTGRKRSTRSAKSAGTESGGITSCMGGPRGCAALSLSSALPARQDACDTRRLEPQP